MANSYSSSDLLPFSTLIHMITVKLSSSNYLLRRNQVEPLLICQDLYGYLDGSISPHALHVTTDGITEANPAFCEWNKQDQKICFYLLSLKKQWLW